MRVNNHAELREIALVNLQNDEDADHMVRSVNYHMESQSRYPQVVALANMGALWTPEDMMMSALGYAIDNWVTHEVTISQAAKDGARTVLKHMCEEAGLKYVHENGRRVWRKPDPAWRDQPIHSGATVGDVIPQDTFPDPQDLDRAEREAEQDDRAGKLRAVFELAVEGIKPLDLPEGITMLDAMHMVGEHGSRDVARQLDTDRDALENRWKTFQRRVTKIMEAMNE